MRMRCALVAIAALVVVPAAAANRPPIGSGQHVWRGVTHVSNLERPWWRDVTGTIGLERTEQRGQASCSAHAMKSLGWVERKLLPVACEQPPRPNLVFVGAIAAFIP
jgi:hypothetical protein